MKKEIAPSDPTTHRPNRLVVDRWHKIVRATDQVVDTSDRFWLFFTACFLRVAQWFIFFFLIWIGYYALTHESDWPFSLRAQTRLAVIQIDGSRETAWDISDATLCVRDKLPSRASAVREITNNETVAATCGGTRWHAYTSATPDGYVSELSLSFGGADATKLGPYTTQFESLADNRFTVRITPMSNSDAPPLRIVNANHVDAVIHGPVMLVWPTPASGISLIFPFRGTAMVGKDVTTRRKALLEQGRIEIYSASDEEATGQSTISSVDLFPGDYVAIADEDSPQRSAASGFIRLSPDALTRDWPAFMITAFGRSDDVRVERYGEAGIDFQPSMWAQLTHDRWSVILTLILFGGLPALATLAEAARLIRRTGTFDRDTKNRK
ncbi:hypothetical protein [Salinisphaera dokdonensis]|uniref:hypothetical protein n=1 Tax=Salinisphaera dokdonensis TaxID=454598 RepID=UPI00333EFEE7